MNLTKLFHFNYLKQNLKKSRVTLAFVLLILPILNLLVFFMQIENTTVNVFSLNELSPLATLGLYIIPVVLSIILFNYVFKKKAIDFIGSMPLNRKTIFVTNTIGGILLIIALIFITTFLIFLVSLFLPNVYIPLGVLIDYFVVFTLSYIFVFSVSNLALSLAGNIPTTLVVTALIVFLVPFLHFVNVSSNHTYKNIYYEGENYTEKYLSGVQEEPIFHYTTPAQAIVNVLSYNENSSLYIDSALGKMALLTILYMLVGFAIFQKKELEVSETSFKNKWIHTLVKSLTLIPFMILVYQLLKGTTSLIGLLFVLVLLLIYYFIYDLITKKSITNIRFNLVSFLITVIVLFPFSALILNEFTNNEDVNIILNDITSITFLNTNLSSIQEIGGTYTTTNKEIIDLVLLGDSSDKMNYIAEAYFYANGKKYRSSIILNDDDQEKLENLVIETQEYKKAKEKMLKNIEIVTIKNTAKLENEDIEVLKNAFKNPDTKKSDFFLPLYVYTYENHQLTKQTFYSNLNKELNQLAVNYYNETFKKKLEDGSFEKIRWAYITDEQIGNYYYYDKSFNLLLDVLKTQNTSVEEKLYRFEVLSNDTVYYYYANLTSDARKQLEFDITSENKDEEGVMETNVN